MTEETGARQLTVEEMRSARAAIERLDAARKTQERRWHVTRTTEVWVQARTAGEALDKARQEQGTVIDVRASVVPMEEET